MVSYLKYLGNKKPLNKSVQLYGGTSLERFIRILIVNCELLTSYGRKHDLGVSVWNAIFLNCLHGINQLVFKTEKGFTFLNCLHGINL